MATEGTLHRHLHEQTTSEIWTRTSTPIGSCWRVAELPPDILHDSLACCSILVQISAWTFFPGLYLLALWLLSRGLVCIGADNLLSCALGARWSALGAPGRLVLSLSLSLSLSLFLFTHLAVLVWLRFSVRLRFRVTSRAGEWRAPASHRSRLRNL